MVQSSSDGVMIALLPTSSEWCTLELPHMTLVYAGTKQERKPSEFNAMAKDAADLAALTSPFSLMVMGIELFGDEERVSVLRFRATPELMAMRRYVERWNASEHPFRPHATIGPATSFVADSPRWVGFDRILVSWGEESLVFSMK